MRHTDGEKKNFLSPFLSGKIADTTKHGAEELTVDDITLRYLELISGKKGNAAVKAWLLYSFCYIELEAEEPPQNSRFFRRPKLRSVRKVTVEEQMARAQRKAHRHFNSTMVPA